MHKKETVQVGPLTITMGPTEEDEARDLGLRLRNPLERVVKSLSDRLQAGLAFLGSLL